MPSELSSSSATLLSKTIPRRRRSTVAEASGLSGELSIGGLVVEAFPGSTGCALHSAVNMTAVVTTIDRALKRAKNAGLIRDRYQKIRYMGSRVRDSAKLA